MRKQPNKAQLIARYDKVTAGAHITGNVYHVAAQLIVVPGASCCLKSAARGVVPRQVVGEFGHIANVTRVGQVP